jgi:NAD(P)-dependent dehydrogenase (short-subunit alcohol dehydrogenase family)
VTRQNQDSAPELGTQSAPRSHRTSPSGIGEPEDAGGAIAELVSDASRRINAQRVEVSGGMNL